MGSSARDNDATTVVSVRRSAPAVGASFLELIVRDVFDARGLDVLGMPLAGRSFVASLSVRD